MLCSRFTVHRLLKMKIALVIALMIIFSPVPLHTAAEGAFDFDVIIKNGLIYDGSGGAPFKADVGC